MFANIFFSMENIAFHGKIMVPQTREKIVFYMNDSIFEAKI